MARYVHASHDPTVAELARRGRRRHQGQGTGTRLVDALAERAREEGLLRFSTIVLAENQPMLSLLAGLGEVRVLHREHETVELSVELPEAGIGRLRELLRGLASGQLKPLAGRQRRR